MSAMALASLVLAAAWLGLSIKALLALLAAWVYCFNASKVKARLLCALASLGNSLTVSVLTCKASFSLPASCSTPSVAKIAVAPALDAARTCPAVQRVDLFQN